MIQLEIIALKAYPRGGDGYTPGSTSNSLNQESGGSFRVIIDTGNWDNSFATNSPGQSGDQTASSMITSMKIGLMMFIFLFCFQNPKFF